MDFRSMVRKALAEKKMTRYRLAKLLGYKRPDPIYDWLAGNRGLPSEKVEKIFEVLGIRPG